jgi:hypothetical protein
MLEIRLHMGLLCNFGSLPECFTAFKKGRVSHAKSYLLVGLVSIKLQCNGFFNIENVYFLH